MQTAEGRRGSGMALTLLLPHNKQEGFVPPQRPKADRGEWVGNGRSREKPLERFPLKHNHGSPCQTWEQIFLPYTKFCSQLVPWESASSSQCCPEIPTAHGVTLATFPSLSHISQGAVFHHHSPAKELKVLQRQGCIESLNIHPALTTR